MNRTKHRDGSDALNTSSSAEQKRLLASVVCMLLIAVTTTTSYADAPNNDELYRMIQELKNNQGTLREEARNAKDAAAAANAELETLKSAGDAAGQAWVTVPQGEPDVSVSLEATYLRPSRSNMDFAIESPTTSFTQTQGKVVSVNPDYTPGGRLGLNWAKGSGNDIGLQFTWLDASDNASAGVPADGLLIGTRLHPNSIIDESKPTSASAAYDFKHYAVDLSVGQRISVGKNLNLRLFGGLRYASLDQDFEVFYKDSVTGRTVNISDRNNFDGIGSRLGFEGDWDIGDGFSIFTEASGSLLVGNLEQKYLDVGYDGISTTNTRVDIEERFENRVVPVVEGRVGITYHAKLASARRLSVSLGYEWQNWYNVVSVVRFSDDVDRQVMSTDTTDIGLGGFFLKGLVSF